MTTPKWNSRAQAVQQNQVAAYDDMRRKCPIAHDDYLGYSVFSHADVSTILSHPEIYSNHVSDRHIAVPSGMDAPEHTAFRKINDKYFTAERMAAFEPVCRQIIRRLISEQPRNCRVEIMEGFAKDYALRIQNAFMGWPSELEQPLKEWIEKNRRATLAQDRPAMAQIALEFDSYIHELLEQRRQHPTGDITDELMHDVVELETGHRTMSEEELVSLIRNWTVGELSTITASAGIVIQFLAAHPQEQQRLREQPSHIPAAVEEIMRLNNPLVSNRRRTRCPVHLDGNDIEAGAQITINWVSVNRDEAAFEHAHEYHPERDQSNNLVYGTGIHACPGAPLARLELRLLVEELLQAFTQIRADETDFYHYAVYPVSGYSELNVWFE